MSLPSVHARYRITGMDCANDAADIEKTVRAQAGVETVRVSTASQTLTFQTHDAGAISKVEAAVAQLGYQLNSLVSDAIDGDAQVAGNVVQVAPAYKRALVLVIVLNVGYGAIEMLGGLAAVSQALKADALDFLGDGLITFLGFLAIRWSLQWRARAALLQGLFLGALGLGVLTTTAYRMFVSGQPEAELMGLFGIIALVVNIAAAVILIPHRTGDANARAVWLFSRNDALGNVAVVIAAALVAWTGSGWPDLVVAALIAGLFLNSAWIIVRDAKIDLREAAQTVSTF